MGIRVLFFSQNDTFAAPNPILRKYTPIAADVTVPSLIFQLSGDLSDGEQVSAGFVLRIIKPCLDSYRMVAAADYGLEST